MRELRVRASGEGCRFGDALGRRFARPAAASPARHPSPAAPPASPFAQGARRARSGRTAPTPHACRAPAHSAPAALRIPERSANPRRAGCEGSRQRAVRGAPSHQAWGRAPEGARLGRPGRRASEAKSERVGRSGSNGARPQAKARGSPHPAPLSKPSHPFMIQGSMFAELSEKLEATFAKLRGRGVLTEADIKEGLREVRRVLLEADVSFQLTREFLERVEKRAVGVAQLKTVSPPSSWSRSSTTNSPSCSASAAKGSRCRTLPPTVVMMVGLQGSGKTTTAAKLARRLKAEGKATRLVAADVYRPAAIDQLETLGRDLDVPVYADRTTKDVVKIAAPVSSRPSGARPRGHHRHRGPSADRRIDDGRAAPRQGRGPAR
jgi:hypothetical protein